MIENKVQDQVGHEQYGLYSALYSIAMLLGIFTDWGINQFLTRSIAQDRSHYEKYFGKIVALKLVVSLIYLPSIVLFATISGFSTEHLGFLFIIGIFHLSVSWINFYRANLQAQHHFKMDAFASVLDKILLIGLILILLAYNISLLGFILASLISVVLTILILVIYSWIRFGKFKVEWDVKFNKDFIISTTSFGIMTILFTANERLNLIMLERLDSDAENGLFAAGFRWTSAVSMFLWTVLPLFFAKFAEIGKDPIKLKPLFEMGWIIVSMVITVVTGVILYYGEHLFFLFKKSTPEDILTMTITLKILIFTVFLNAFFNIFSTWLTANGFEKPVNKILFIALLVNIILNFIFIPFWGSIGASIATVIAYFVQSMGFLILFNQKAPISINFKLLFKLIFIALIYFVLLGVFKFRSEIF